MARPPKLTEEQLLAQLTEVFRQHGYAGSSLSILSRATGLSRASLYHRFPGGKADMALAVLAHVNGHFVDHLLAPLRAEGAPRARLRIHMARMREFFAEGALSCVLESLSLACDEPGADRMRGPVAASARAWLDALHDFARDAGATPAEARRRAERALIHLEGALVVGRSLADPKVFDRAQRQLPALLLGK